MISGRSLAPWVVAGVALVVTIVFSFVDPFTAGESIPQQTREELASAVGKAATYYEFGHYERAAESYELAIERGMTDAVEWYRYAHALEMSSGRDLDTYARAYRLLLDQAPAHEYVEEAESVLVAGSQAFIYDESEELEPGTLVRFTGTITRVVRGRISSNTDTLYLATRPDEWLGHIGEEVKVQAPRLRGVRAGDAIRVIGRFEGICTTDDGAGLARDYPCVEAAGVRPVASR
jgi:tetratricopeptide (TPR) repeat protein